MDQRTKILASTLCGLIVLWGGYKLFYKWGYEPILQKKAQITAKEEALDKQQHDLAQLARAKKQLKDWTEQSLPPNEEVAHNLYYNWFTELAEMIGFEDLKTGPGNSQTVVLGKGTRKKKLYTTLPITLDGKTTFSRLNRFLYYFHRTKMMHRITSLRITSDDNVGDPVLTVKMTAEALSLTKAPKRKRIFPETTLELPVESDAETLRVILNKAFPTKGPIHVRVGKTMLTVTNRDGQNWTVKPGIETIPDDDLEALEDLPKGTRVELLPLHSTTLGTLADYRKDVYGPGKSPFVLPEPPVEYDPRWNGLDNQKIARGESLEMQVELVDFDPKKGKLISYSLGKSEIKALTIDDKTGEIKWEPAESDKPGEYSVEILAYQDKSDEPTLTGSILVTLQNLNSQPVLEAIADQKAMIDQELKFLAKATDPDETDTLTFKLTDAPEGAVIDETTGEFTWTPPETLTPGEITFTISVSDNREGDPKSDSHTITVSLGEDKARFTYLIGVVTESGDRQAWLYDVSTRNKVTLTEGLPFEASGISGFVYVIGNDFIEYQSGKETWRLEVGEKLTARQLLAPPIQKAALKEAPKSTTNEPPEKTVKKTDSPNQPAKAIKPTLKSN
jgi:hypothetical protein